MCCEAVTWMGVGRMDGRSVRTTNTEQHHNRKCIQIPMVKTDNMHETYVRNARFPVALYISHSPHINDSIHRRGKVFWRRELHV